jgi:hypothetical protein
VNDEDINIDESAVQVTDIEEWIPGEVKLCENQWIGKSGSFRYPKQRVIA